MATILELTGTVTGPATPSDLDGLSFAAALKDPPASSRLRDIKMKYKARSDQARAPTAAENGARRFLD